MAELLDLIVTAPATWGVAGAVIYTGPRWLACVYTSDTHRRCSLEALICLAVGAIAAAAFARWVTNFLHQAPADLQAVAAMIGLLANPVAPRLVDGITTAASNAIAARTGKILKGDEK